MHLVDNSNPKGTMGQRKIIQLVTIKNDGATTDMIVGLADDGTVWFIDGDRTWKLITSALPSVVAQK